MFRRLWNRIHNFFRRRRPIEPKPLPADQVPVVTGEDAFKVEIHGIKKASEAEKAVFKQASAWIEYELNSKDFWQVAHERWQHCTHKTYKDDGVVYSINFNQFKAMVLSGQDRFNEVSDRDLDFHVTLYYSAKRVIGYTYPTTWWTWFNRRYFNHFDVADIAGNIFHEYLHNLGMDHPNTDRMSVVYQMGYLLRDRVREQIKEQGRKVA